MQNILNPARPVSTVPQLASLFIQYDRHGKRLPLPAQIVKFIFRPQKALYRLDSQEPTPDETRKAAQANH